MITTATFSENGAEVTFRKSLRHAMFYRLLRDALAGDESVSDHLERAQYAWMAAFVVGCTGLDWTPPKLGDTAKQIEAGYQAFLDAVPDFETFNGLLETVNNLHAPTADPVQKPDEALTETERADPN